MKKPALRLICLLAGLILLLTVCLTASASDDWRLQQFELTYGTMSGPVTVTAVPLQSDEKHAFYAQVPSESVGGVFILHAYHPFHAWYYDIPDGTGLTISSFPAEFVISGIGESGLAEDTFFLTVGTLPAAEFEGTQQPQQPQQQMTATVMIGYYDSATGSLMETGTFGPYPDGEYIIQAQPSTLDSSWQPDGDTSARVVISYGQAQPSMVSFFYTRASAPTQPPATQPPATQPPATATPYVIPVSEPAVVMVQHVDAETGAALMPPEMLTLTDGWHTVSPRMDISGYDPESDTSEQVHVAGGVANPSDITFRYRASRPQATATARTALITVRYLDADTGRSLSPDQIYDYGDGDYLIEARPASLPDGYQPAGDTAVIVSVSGGVASMPQINFYYRYQAPATEVPIAVSVTVHLMNTQGQQVGFYSHSLSQAGVSQIPVDERYVPSEYSAAGVALQSVTVYTDGSVSPTDIYYTLSRRPAAETPIPHGELINRWSRTTSSVRFREGSSTSDRVIRNLSNGSWVWAIRDVCNSAGEYWTYVQVDGRYGYIMSSYLDVLSQAESDSRQNSLYTPAPYSDWGAPTEPPIVTVQPNITAQPTKYMGYAQALNAADVRETTDSRSAQTGSLVSGELVYVEDQRYDSRGAAWSLITSMENGTQGYVPDAYLKHINQTEAQIILDAIDLNRQMNATERPAYSPTAYVSPTPTAYVVQPTVSPTATAPDNQVVGYAYTIGDDVRLRSTYSDRSVILNTLRRNTAVFVAGQIYNPEDGWYWHSVQYTGTVGYIRSDMLRMMSAQEQNDYLRGIGTATPAPQTTPEPLNGLSLSSYGYVTNLTGNSFVNMRREPSTGSKVVRRLYQYALCRVYGSTQAGGKTWYNVSYDNGVTTGYVVEDYFHHMTLDEFNAFMGSEEYQLGVRNNTGSTGSTAAPTYISTEEEQLSEQWRNPNNNLNVTYATWQPIPTTPPLATGTAEGVTASPAPTSTPSPTYAPISTPEPIATVTPQPTGRGGGLSTGTVIAIVLFVVGIGTGYIYTLHRRNRRNAAQRAAQRRAQAAAAQRNPDGRHYARPASDGQRPGNAPRAGTYTSVPPQNSAPGYTPRDTASPPVSLQKTYEPYTQRRRRSERRRDGEE
ncbi:MAG: hypothetical protein IKP40_08370 [Clostridia bacterium]|nr:hypothetical protein [Clostridia bacterium]